MAENSVSIDNLNILDVNGTARVPISGDFTSDALAKQLIDEWVPAKRCYKGCCRFGDCVTTRDLDLGEGENPGYIKCGTYISAIESWVENTFMVFSQMTQDEKQIYLDAAYYYASYIGNSEIAIGNLIDKDSIKFWFDDVTAPINFASSISLLRDDLVKLMRLLNKLPQFRSRRAILFVEGETERAFLNKMKESNLGSYTLLRIKIYDGIGNLRSRRIEMLLNHLKDDGYRIFVQADGDGTSRDLRILEEKELVAMDKSFIFTHDFESSIPTPLLIAALEKMGYQDSIDAEKFEEKRSMFSGTVIDFLKNDYDIDLSGRKIELAKVVAGIIVEEDLWWTNDEFMETELGKFMHFVETVVH